MDLKGWPLYNKDDPMYPWLRKGGFFVNGTFLVLYLAPLFALLLTWKKPLASALRWIVVGELVGVALFFLLYALVGLHSWHWVSWGSVNLQDILLFWKGGGFTAALWIWPGVGETALLLLIRWGIEALRRLERAGAVLPDGENPQG